MLVCQLHTLNVVIVAAPQPTITIIICYIIIILLESSIRSDQRRLTIWDWNWGSMTVLKTTLAIFLATHLSLVVMINGLRDSKSMCHLWHIEQMGKCKCASTLPGLVVCDRESLVIANKVCLTWDNETDTIRASYCLYIPIDYTLCKIDLYKISTKLSGSELNKWMCGNLKRQGARCKQCFSGYGPAALSDGVDLLCWLLKA